MSSCQVFTSSFSSTGETDKQQQCTGSHYVIQGLQASFQEPHGQFQLMLLFYFILFLMLLF